MLDFISGLNILVVVLMTTLYFYQIVYIVVGLVRRRAKPEPEPSRLHKFAAVICARNEAEVIEELVKSLKAQRYPAELLDIYVLADNCTDQTARCAREAGAIVYERRNTQEVGKGYALDYLFRRIRHSHNGNSYDAYFVFDADNVVHPDFAAEMNKTFSRGYEVVTCYRNSKNFASNWISAGYSIWFLREARFLNFPRMLFGNSCAVSGTGFLVSDSLIRENGGWPFHLLTEDIQFSVNCALSGHRIGYCDRAVVYDEQPTSFSQSWAQRLRWSKGFYQVNAHYSPLLIKGIFRNKGFRMSCYDMLITIAPGTLLTLFVFALNAVILFACLTQPYYIVYRLLKQVVRFLFTAVVNFYLGMFVLAVLTVLSEWKQIDAPPLLRIFYTITFPLFMATYFPIAIVALIRKVEWKPIHHGITASKRLRALQKKE